MRSRALEPLLLAALALLPAAASAAPPPLPRGGEIHVNVSTHGTHRQPVVAAFPDGGFVVVWTNVSVIHARFFKADGSPESGEFRLTERPEGSIFQQADGIVADRDGSFLVSWSESIDSEYYVRARRFSRQGAPLGPVVEVDPPGSPGGGSAIALGPRGRFAVAWSAGGPRPATGDYPSTLARIFNADGAPATGAFPIAYGYAGSIAGDDAIYVYLTGLVWGPGGTLSAAFYENEVPGLNHFYLSRFPSRGGAPSYLSLPESVFCCFETQSYSSSRSVALAKAADNSLIAAWPETAVREEGLKARRLAADGTHLGAAFTVAKRPSVLQVKPAVATLADGGFVIVWLENGRDGSGDGIFGRAFAAAATALSRDFRVNLTTEGDQGRPAIAANPAGTVMVVWESPTRSDIFARLLTP
jgi:hypothetical protein